MSCEVDFTRGCTPRVAIELLDRLKVFDRSKTLRFSLQPVRSKKFFMLTVCNKVVGVEFKTPLMNCEDWIQAVKVISTMTGSYECQRMLMETGLPAVGKPQV